MTAVDGIRKHGTAASYNKGCRCDRCSTAKRIKSQAYYQANRERIRERNRAWYAANKAQATETARKWQRANPEKVRGYVAKWSAANPDWERKWVAANPDKVAAKYKRYYESDKGLEFRRQMAGGERRQDQGGGRSVAQGEPRQGPTTHADAAVQASRR